MFLNNHDQILLFVLGQCAIFAALNAGSSIAAVREYLDRLLSRFGMPASRALVVQLDPASQAVTVTAMIGNASVSSTSRVHC